MEKSKCYRCGGIVKYYDGALGYEAMVCQKCGHHYAEPSEEEFNLNKQEWENKNKSMEKQLIAKRVCYGKASTPVKDREYQILGNGPVGTKKEIQAWIKLNKYFFSVKFVEMDDVETEVNK